MSAAREVSNLVASERAKADAYRALVRPFVQGFADSTHRGTRYGPVHLFTGGNEWDAVALCGRRVKLWNFEGETESDFCPRCIEAARTKNYDQGLFPKTSDAQ